MDALDNAHRDPNRNSGRDADQAQRDAVDAAAADPMLDGSVHDAHAEVSQDTDRAGERSRDGDPDPAVTQQHREQAAAVEKGDYQSTRGALGATAADRREDPATDLATEADEE